jgi:micrococcal nuclease
MRLLFVILAVGIALAAPLAAGTPSAEAGQFLPCQSFKTQEDLALGLAAGVSIVDGAEGDNPCPDTATMADLGLDLSVPPVGAVEAVLVAVTDSATLEVKVADVPATVRVLTAAAPALGDGCGTSEAMAFAAGLLTPGAAIWLSSDPALGDTDGEGRLRRHVWYQLEDGTFRLLAYELARNGAALPADPGSAVYPYTAEATRVAGMIDSGIWGLCRDTPDILVLLGQNPVILSQTGVVPLFLDTNGFPAGSIPCDTAYPGICLPPAPPDLDCSDIVVRDFVVLPPDPHGLDANGDGLGCVS